jgi:hypothetical protein
MLYNDLFLPMWFLVICAVLVVIVITAVYARLTNPFFRFTIVNDPLKDFTIDTDLELNEQQRFVLRHKKFFKGIALFKAGWHILANAWSKKKASQPQSLTQIITTIHQMRFNTSLPFIISGDHFSILYPRSLGIFYYSLLDPRIPASREDWNNRQAIYTKTLLYALKVFSQSSSLATTIVPISRHSVALLNIYAYPSDTLYSLLVAFENLLGSEPLLKRYPYTVKTTQILATQNLAQQMLVQYKQVLQNHWERYSADVLDPTTGLIKKHWLLSGTKDIARRQCAFYDNVIYWKTWQLAQNLGIIEKNTAGLSDLKQTILETFWDSESSVFLEDLNDISVSKKLTSSDWLIAYQVGFLTPESKADLKYLIPAVDTIISTKLDQPFGLPYHRDLRPWQPYLPVKIAAPLYASQVIWSHWGVEYMKLLAHIGSVTANKSYTEAAVKQCKQYEANILKTGGYPEVYDPNGQPYSHHGYTSVHQTGWIINFEQARTMISELSRQEDVSAT